MIRPILILIAVFFSLSVYSQKKLSLSEKQEYEKMRLTDNVSVEEFLQYKASERAALLQQQSAKIITSAPLSTNLSLNSNIDFEFGSTLNWQVKNGVSGNPPIYTSNVNRFAAINGGVDSISGLSLVSPLGGNYVVKMNRGSNNGQGDFIEAKNSIMVMPGLTTLKFAYQLVLEPAHGCNENPRFQLEILDSTQNTVLYKYLVTGTTVTCPGSNTVGLYPVGTMMVCNWQTICVDLSSHVSKCVVLKLKMADCGVAVHTGYGYFDAIMVNQPGPGNVTVNSIPYPFAPTNTICFNRQSTITAPAGFTYTWSTIPYGSFSSNLPAITPSVGGTYDLAMTHSTGCVYKKHFTVSSFSLGLGPFLQNKCNGQATTLTGPSSGTNPYLYNWSNGSVTTSILTGTQYPQSYSLTLTDYFTGCQDDIITYSINPFPSPTVSVVGGNTMCVTSTKTLSVSGASSVNWVTIPSSSNPVVITPSVVSKWYYVNGVTVNGCSFSDSINIVDYSSGVNLTAADYSICVGDSVLLTASGGISYTWPNMSAVTNTVYVKPTTTSIYSVNISHALCGSYTRTATINVYTPSLTISAPTVVCTNKNFNISLGANTSYSYSYSNGVNPVSGVVNPPFTSFLTFSPTVISFTAVNVGGCISYSTVSISVNITPTVNISTPTLDACLGQTYTITANGASTYTWFNTANVGTGPQHTLTVNNVNTAGNSYYAVGTSSNGCTAQSSALTFTGNSFSGFGPTASPTVCVGNTVAVSFWAPALYSLANFTLSGGPTPITSMGIYLFNFTLTPTAPTIYTLAVDNFGCGISTSTVNINSLSLPLPTITISSPSPTMCAFSSMPLTASGASSYTWAPNIPANPLNISPTVGGLFIYTVTGKSSAGCKSSATHTVSVLSNTVALSTSGFTTICSGGQATLIANGASSYSWSTGVTTNSITLSPTSNTSYTVIGFDASGCSKQLVKNIQVYPAFTPSIFVINSNSSVNDSVLCAGQYVKLGVGAAPLIQWSTGATTSSILAQPSLNTLYSVTVTSNIYFPGCKGSAVYNTTVLPLPTPSITSSNFTSCVNGAPIQFTGLPSGGLFADVPSDSYTWQPVNTSTYTAVYSYTDNAGCKNTVANTVTLFPKPCCLNLASVNDYLCIGQSETYTPTPLGGTYNYTNIISGNVITPTAAGIYTVVYTYTNSFGCVDSISSQMNVSNCVVGLNDNFISSDYKVYPNPFTDGIIVEADKAEVLIYTSSGQLILREEISMKTKIDASRFASGLYLLKINLSSGSFMSKIIKQ